MGRYVLKRILLIIPTLLMVMVIAFFLSKSVPGDAASALLVLQGVQLDGPNAVKEYERNYKNLKLDKPTFYFSVLPHFYPKNIGIITSDTERKQIINFLHQKFDYASIIAYIKTRDQFIQHAYALNGDTLFSKIVPNLLFETSTEKLKIIVSHLYTFDIPDLYNEISAVSKSLENMILSKSVMYYPKIYWHGSDNQFNFWFKEILKGNFGISLKDGRLVADKITSALKWTLILIFLNVIISSLVSIPAGLYAGYREGGWFDRLSSFLGLILYSTPVFWLASLCIIFCTSDKYSIFLNIFPIPGTWYIPEGQHFLSTVWQFSSQLVLPVICLVANDIAQLSRITKNNVIEQKTKLYVTLAKAKGLNQWLILKRHIMPNVLLPLVTVIGGKIPSGLSGALIVEIIFNIPGMGRLMYESIFSSDWNVVFAILLVVSVFTILFILIVDMMYAVINPKIKTALA